MHFVIIKVPRKLWFYCVVAFWKGKYIHICVYAWIYMCEDAWLFFTKFLQSYSKKHKRDERIWVMLGKRGWRKENNRYKFLPVSSGIHSSCLMIHVSLYPGVVGGQKQTWLHYRQLFHNNSGPFFISCLPSQQNTG